MTETILSSLEAAEVVADIQKRRDVSEATNDLVWASAMYLAYCINQAGISELLFILDHYEAYLRGVKDRNSNTITTLEMVVDGLKHEVSELQQTVETLELDLVQLDDRWEV